MNAKWFRVENAASIMEFNEIVFRFSVVIINVIRKLAPKSSNTDKHLGNVSHM